MSKIMKVKCYSVRLSGLTSISPKCFRAVGFDGSEALLPASQVFGEDFEAEKSEAWWISAWILERKALQYSRKKTAWFDSGTGRMLPSVEIKKHTPSKEMPIDNFISTLHK